MARSVVALRRRYFLSNASSSRLAFPANGQDIQATYPAPPRHEHLLQPGQNLLPLPRAAPHLDPPPLSTMAVLTPISLCRFAPTARTEPPGVPSRLACLATR